MYYAGKALGNDMVWFLHRHKAGMQISVYPYECSENNHIRKICWMFGQNKISLQIVSAVLSGVFHNKEKWWDIDLNGTLHWACRFIVPSIWLTKGKVSLSIISLTSSSSRLPSTRAHTSLSTCGEEQNSWTLSKYHDWRETTKFCSYRHKYTPVQLFFLPIQNIIHFLPQASQKSGLYFHILTACTVEDSHCLYCWRFLCIYLCCYPIHSIYIPILL